MSASRSIRGPWPRASWRAFGLVVAAAFLGGCASHSQSLVKVREALVAGKPESAYQQFAKGKKKDQDLLYLLERGYLACEAGKYDSSNIAFEAAERRAEELYTKSISAEVASLAVNDLVLPYRGRPHELVMIHYYRAFNYLALGQRDEALVEARKANQRLTELADEKEGKRTYKNDAFMQYFTAMLYESAGEFNDAAVAYRDAYRAYEDYKTLYGVSAPPSLESDLYAALKRVGANNETALLEELDPSLESTSALRMHANAVVFVETGFVPYLESVDITIPVFEDKDSKYRDCHDCESAYADVLASRYGDNIYGWRQSNLKLDHVLRFAFPMMTDFPSQAGSVAVACSLETSQRPVLAQPLGAIARRSFEEKIPKVLLKTVGRALVKEFARKAAKKEDKALGVLVNIFGVATEQADTRSCLFFPQNIWMAQLELPPGKHALEVSVRGPGGAEIERLPVTVDVPREGIGFARIRSFR
jgi:hypothetical protein